MWILCIIALWLALAWIYSAIIAIDRRMDRIERLLIYPEPMPTSKEDGRD